jgi:EmrB/QacA subfamily drug resistance transporter
VTVADPIALSSRRGRWVLAVTVLGTGIALIEATVLNVALETLGRDLGAGVDDIQWVVNAYMLTLASLILFGGALGDRIGRRRVFVIGIVWFTVASALCAVAPSVGVLIAARALQGIGGALLTPGSLAIIEAVFQPDDRARAIGAWTGLVSIAAALGPLLGGWLVDVASWRAVFLINIPIGAVVVALALRHVPESRDAEGAGPLDTAGAALATVALAGVTVALIQAPAGTSPAIVGAAALVGIAAAVAFVQVERRHPRPMLPLELFRSSRFSGANALTFVVWGPISAIFLFLVVYLQVSLSYSPLESGAALLPVTVVMLTLSARVGALAQRIGARPFLTLGPLLFGAGVLAIGRIEPGDGYWDGVLPPLLLFAFGLVSLVAPVTAVALQGAGTRYAGVASGINNAIARTAQLLAIAVLPPLAGLSGDAYSDPLAVADAFHTAMFICAGVAAVGSVIGFVTIRGPGPPA